MITAKEARENTNNTIEGDLKVIEEEIIKRSSDGYSCCVFDMYSIPKAAIKKLESLGYTIEYDDTLKTPEEKVKKIIINW